jgi:hypothetical protein
MALDDLGQQEAGGPNQARPVASPRACPLPEDRPRRTDVGYEAVHAEEGAASGAGAHRLQQPGHRPEEDA